MRFKVFCVILISVLIILSTSCKTDHYRSYLQNEIYWSEDESSGYKPFDVNISNNIRSLTPTDSYIYLRIPFTLTPELKDKDLGLVIPTLHFADKLYLNGEYCGGYGSFPPDMRSALFQSHIYFFSRNILNQDGENEIIIKVYAHGKSLISKYIYLEQWDDAVKDNKFENFFSSRIYIYFVGGMFTTVCLFFLLYIWRRKNKEYLSFSGINFWTLMFSMTFYAPEVPFYDQIPYFQFIKFTFCISFYFIIYNVTSFILIYLKSSKNVASSSFRIGLLFLQIFLTVTTKNYEELMHITKTMLLLSFIQLSLALVAVVRALFKDTKKALMLILFFAPVLLSILTDAIVKIVFDMTNTAYISMFGWQISIIIFVFVLTHDYNKTITRNEYLTSKLELEVEAKTHSLSVAMEKSNLELEMASIVQSNFFPLPKRKFKGWDMAIVYKPLAKVSGDLYDYYNTKDFLNGLALFDVSGHGIAASLITMLSKNIIYREFDKCRNGNYSISEALKNINASVIATKGKIENYLTGILIKIDDFDKDDACHIEFANAGHPNPILFKSRKDQISEIKCNTTKQQYGVIGISGIDVSFPTVDFYMEENDILICYTDGLTETTNEQLKQFGKDRTEYIVRQNCYKSADEIANALIYELKEYAAGQPLSDDITIIVLKREYSKNYIEELYSE